MIRYLINVSGYSRQQLTRLIRQYRKTGTLKRRQRTVAGFTRKYTAADIRRLAAMDDCHDLPARTQTGTPCGPAVKKLCERACAVLARSSTLRWPRSP